MSDKALNTVVVTIVGLAKGRDLRATELGAKPRKNGDKFRVSTDLAKKLSKRYGAILKVGEEVTKGSVLKHGDWEELGAAKTEPEGSKKPEAPVEPEGKPEAGEKIADGKTPANKDLAGKAQAKK